MARPTPAKRFATLLQPGTLDKQPQLFTGPWQRCQCGECPHSYPTNFVSDLLPKIQAVRSDGRLSWLEMLSAVFYDPANDQAALYNSNSGDSGVGLNLNDCPSILTAARYWRRDRMDVLADFVVDACAVANAVIEHGVAMPMRHK